MIERNSEGRPLTAAEVRRTSKCRALLEHWWQAIPDPDKPPMVRGWQMVEATGKPIEQLAPALRQLGWLRVQYREHRGVPRLYWIPPGFPNPVRPVGRPPGRADNRLLPGDRCSTSPQPEGTK